jgi:hypothetical protein
MRKQIPRDIKPLERLLVVSGLIIIGLILFTVLFMGFRLGWSRPIVQITQIIILAFGSLSWLIGAVIAKKKWSSEHYEYDKTALYVTISEGLFGGTKTEIYRFSSVLSLTVNQTKVQSKYRVGDIVITIARMDKPVSLRYVKEPDVLIDKIRATIGNSKHLDVTQDLQ